MKWPFHASNLKVSSLQENSDGECMNVLFSENQDHNEDPDCEHLKDFSIECCAEEPTDILKAAEKYFTVTSIMI